MSEADYLTEDLPALLERLADYVDLDTPGGDAQRLNALSDKIKTELDSIGCRTGYILRSGGNLLHVSLGADGGRRVLLLGHMDTVFGAGEAARRPFSDDGGILHGPGVLDMKSGLCLAIEVFRHFSHRLPDGCALDALFNCDEEIGSCESEASIRSACRGETACICMEPSKPGFCTVARKGLYALKIDVTGVAAHSGTNYEKGRSAVEALCGIVTRLYALRDDKRSLTVNVGKLEGGKKINIVADHASCSFEFRCYEPSLAAQTLGRIRAICADTGIDGTKAELTLLSSRPPMVQSEASKRLFDAARRRAESHGLTLTGRTHGGGSDGSFTADCGLPTLDGMGAEGENSHTEAEYVKRDTLMARLYTVIDTIDDIFS